jgi:cysteine desulfurase
MCRELGVPLHVDAAQSYGRLKYSPASSGISLLSISGHKLYATTGIGALFVSDGVGRLLRPIVTGGGQEKGLRSGTVSPFLAVGLGAAADLAENLRETESVRLQRLRSRFLKVLGEAFPRVDIVGQKAPRLPGALSIKLHGVDADRLVGAVQPRLAISTGSACASGELHASYVLRAMGLSEDAAASVIRIGMGRFTTEAEVEEAARTIGQAAAQQAGE